MKKNKQHIRTEWMEGVLWAEKVTPQIKGLLWIEHTDGMMEYAIYYKREDNNGKIDRLKTVPLEYGEGVLAYLEFYEENKSIIRKEG